MDDGGGTEKRGNPDESEGMCMRAPPVSVWRVSGHEIVSNRTSSDRFPVQTLSRLTYGRCSYSPLLLLARVRAVDSPNGLYYINVDGAAVQVECSMTVSGGGWTLIASFVNTDCKCVCVCVRNAFLHSCVCVRVSSIRAPELVIRVVFGTRYFSFHSRS